MHASDEMLTNEAESDNEQDLRKFTAQFLKPASTLFAVQKVQGATVREETTRAYRKMVDAHLLITGVLAAAIERVGGKVVETSPAYEERTALFASFVIGMDLCERAIEEGRYLQALTLVRQEMEIIAQLITITRGKRQEGKQPKVTVLEEPLRRLYDDLSAAAHVSRHHIVRAATEMDVSTMELPGATSGTRYFPVFDETIARRCFSLHLMLVLRLIEQMSIDYHEQYAPEDHFRRDDANALELAVSLMVAEEMFEDDRASA